jgi:hypothetical protein
MRHQRADLAPRADGLQRGIDDTARRLGNFGENVRGSPKGDDRPRPADIAFALQVTLHDMHHGAVKRIAVTRDRMCTACRGGGVVRRTTCDCCRGAKVVPERKVLEVHVQRGTRIGDAVRLAGDGDQLPGGSAPGDVVITMALKRHDTPTPPPSPAAEAAGDPKAAQVQQVREAFYRVRGRVEGRFAPHSERKAAHGECMRLFYRLDEISDVSDALRAERKELAKEIQRTQDMLGIEEERPQTPPPAVDPKAFQVQQVRAAHDQLRARVEGPDVPLKLRKGAHEECMRLFYRLDEISDVSDSVRAERKELAKEIQRTQDALGIEEERPPTPQPTVDPKAFQVQQVRAAHDQLRARVEAPGVPLKVRKGAHEECMRLFFRLDEISEISDALRAERKELALQIQRTQDALGVDH